MFTITTAEATVLACEIGRWADLGPVDPDVPVSAYRLAEAVVKATQPGVAFVTFVLGSLEPQWLADAAYDRGRPFLAQAIEQAIRERPRMDRIRIARTR